MGRDPSHSTPPVFRRAAGGLLLGLLCVPSVGCSDYSLTDQDKADDAGTDAVPALGVDPELLDKVICVEGEHELLLSNDGEGVLEVLDLYVSGDGWEVSGPATPFKIAPGGAEALSLTGTEGDAELVIESNDPDRPLVGVPLAASADAAPQVSITAPSSNDVFDQSGDDVLLEGFISDDLDQASDLVVTWSSDVGGVISTDSSAADGTTSVAWAAASRADGDHLVTLEAEDSCGNVSSTEIAVCQNAGYEQDELDLTDWNFEGNATWDSSNGWLQLTDVGEYEIGSAFETSTAVTGDAVEIQFAFFIGNGSGADGISLTALDTDRATSFLGGEGCGLGYGGDASCTDGPALPGWSIEVDTYFNDGHDPTPEDHLAFSFDGDVDAPATWVALPEMEDTGWHHMVVEVAAPHVTVSIDGVTFIDEDLSGNFEFPAYVGFTAGTGGLTNQHLIDSLQVTEYICE